tara:strand:- start:166 stop:390 length:225 start_codon:yes stop_codon:yes gene_type:complete
MEWIDSWNCKKCGSSESETHEVCHKCGYRRKRLINTTMVPWLLAILTFGGIGIIKLYVDANEHDSHGEHSEGGH